MSEPLQDNTAHRIHRMHSTKGRVFGGILIVVVGTVLLLKQLGVTLPSFFFTWEMLLIVIGLYAGLKHNFKRPGWLVLVSVGLLFMLDDVFPGIQISQYFWPVVIIVFGAMMIFTAGKRKERWKDWHRCQLQHNQNSAENMLDVFSMMGGVKKNVISKEFKGGEITCIMGGAEVNLSQADFEGRAVLEITQIFGGTTLIIPANWQIESESVAILGGIDDKRNVAEHHYPSTKILVLKGVTFFGGIEIKSY